VRFQACLAAAEAGDVDPDAQYDTGICLLDGAGVKANAVLAVFWIRRVRYVKLRPN
jgi:TPR repeat protein